MNAEVGDVLERMRTAAKREVDKKQQSMYHRLLYPISPRKSYGHVGIELEMEGNYLPKAVGYYSPKTKAGWKPSHDGSLRGESLEYITSKPVDIDELDGMLKALWEAFAACDTRLKLSNRCSTHVHVNFSTLTAKPITSFIALYGIVEEAVTHWCGADRTSNPFCLRMVDSMSTIDNWSRVLQDDDGVLGEHFGNGNKYSSLNIKPLFTQGSIEIRCMRGADQQEDVLNWAKFLWALREEARTTYQNPNRLASAVSAMGVTGVIEAIIAKYDLLAFWTDVAEHPDNVNRMDSLLRRGFLLVQPLLFLVNWDIVPDAEELDLNPAEDAGVDLLAEALQAKDRLVVRRRRAAAVVAEVAIDDDDDDNDHEEEEDDDDE